MNIENNNILDPINLLTTRVSIPYPDLEGVFAYASGFFYRFKSKVFLVTNHHVVSGRRISDNQPVSDTGFADPVEIKISLLTTRMRWQIVKVKLIEDDNEKYIFDKSRALDIAAIDVTTIINDEYQIRCIQDFENENAVAELGVRITIMGYPNGYAKNGLLPIWKSGYIATEPNISSESFLIDARTFGGMSGSPVAIVRKNESFKTQTSQYISGNNFTLLGIYSDRPTTYDRFEDKYKEMGLGTVWKRQGIERILGDT